MEDTGLKALLAGGAIIYILVLVAGAVVACLLVLAPLTLYRIHWRLIEIRDLLRQGAMLPTAAARQDDGPRLILPSGPAGFGPQRALVIAAGIVGLAVLLMIGWMVAR
jgi:hypothetical protein